ncbi:MAG: ATP-binding protein [Pseudomonadota bacterium]
MTKRRSLIWHLYPSYLLIIILSLFAVTWYASTSLRHFFLKEVEVDLRVRASLLEKQILAYLDPLDQKGMDAFCKRIGQRASTRITVLLASGKVVGDSDEDPARMDNHLDRPEVIKALTEGTGSSTRYSHTIQKNMLYLAMAVEKGGQKVGVIRTAIAINAIDEAIKAIQIKIVLAGLIIAALSAMIGFLVARRISGPIKEIEKGARSFAGGDLESRLPIPNVREIAGLAETMNLMAKELREQINTVTRQKNQLEAVLSSMTEGVIAVDSEEYIIIMNQSAADMLGVHPSKVLGRSIQEASRNTELHEFLKRALNSQQIVDEDVIIHSEVERIVNLHGTVLRDEMAKRMGALMVMNDVTSLRRLENVRRDFVANVSHEIKTPITAIKGYAETLQEGSVKDPEDAKRFLRTIERHVERLEAIIDDLLTLSRIEKEEEQKEILLEKGPLRDVLEGSIQVCQTKAQEKDIGFELNCDDRISVWMNPPLLELAVVNLLDNAIKYSDKGAVVKIDVNQIDNEVVINVRDHGPGIAKEHLSRIFERFYRADRGRSRKLGGTGLGLSIVKHITQAHGGRISVESTSGKGSTFSIHLPLC